MNRRAVRAVIAVTLIAVAGRLPGDDAWLGWSLGSLSAGYDVYHQSELNRITLGEVIWYNEDKRAGLTISPLEFSFGSHRENDHVALPIEGRYSFLRLRETGGIEGYVRGAIRLDDPFGEFRFEGGIRIGTTLRSDKTLWWYSPSFSVSQFVTTDSEIVSAAEIDLGFLLYAIGLAETELSRERYSESSGRGVW